MIFATWTSLFNNSVSKKCTFVLGDFTLWQFNNRKRGELFQCVFKMSATMPKCVREKMLDFISFGIDAERSQLMNECSTDARLFNKLKSNEAKKN